MGYWKNKMIEWDARGYKDIDTVVCHYCFGDYAIKNYIKLHGERQKCDYCHKLRKSFSLEEVIGLIVSSANAEYEDATGCMGYCSREGGFIGAKTYDLWDFVYEILNQEMEVENESLLTDIYKTLNDSITWCERDPYALRLHENDFFEWKEFTEQVKSNPSNSVMNYPILEKVSSYLEQLEVIIHSNKTYGFYRSIGHEKNKYPSTAKDIGAAPVMYAAANRFSKNGQSMFYGAEDVETTFKEINAAEYEAVTSAKFYPTKRLLLLDLTKIKSIWFSLFDEERRELRSPLVFLRKFQYEISKPINGKVKEYLPTQIFSNYLKTIFKTEDGKQIDGILYESSKNPNKKCCALFFDNNDMSDKNNPKYKRLYMDSTTLNVSLN